MKAVLISIRPEWCKLIATDQKTVEVRKTVPKIPTPFKCYIYCTKTAKSPLLTVITVGMTWLISARTSLRMVK